MEEQSKEGKKRKRKGTQRGAEEAVAADAAASGDVGANDQGGGNGLSDFPPEIADQARAALSAEEQSVDKGIDAWKKVVAAASTSWPARRELARVYRKAERWNALIEVLKDAVEKAAWSSPGDKVAVLFEMVEVYRDRLRLDVMVVTAFNQILAIEPGNLAAADALAAQYEAMKRWPDLIAVLRKRATVVEEPADKVALHLRIASLYLDKFTNQAEAIKEFEAVLELDPTNADALSFLKQMYEKRRDWEKLIGVHQKEVERIAEVGERATRLVEIAKLATEKLKKPSVCIDLWQKVLAADDTHGEALAELEKLYEREKAWEDLGRVLERQAALTDDGAKKTALLTKLAILFTEKVQAAERAIKAWLGILEIDPENRRAQDGLKALYTKQKDWEALESFYGARGKWDELVRVFERQIDLEDDASRPALWNRVGQLYRDKLGKPDRAQKAYEKALSLDARNPEAAEALIPLFEQAGDARHLADVLRVQLGHTTDHAQRQERMQRLVALLKGDAGDKLGGLSIALEAIAEEPLAIWARESAEQLAAEVSGFQALAATYEAAFGKIQDDKAALPLLATLARAYEKELGQPELAIARNQTILASAPDDGDAIEALERLYIATTRFPELLAIYDKKLSLARSDAERLDIRTKLAGLYEEEMRQPEKAVELNRAIVDAEAGYLPAWKALDRLYQGLGRWQELADVLVREIALVADNGERVELKFRQAVVLEAHLKDASGAVEAYREALEWDRTHAAARAGLEVYLADDGDRQMVAVSVLEPIYEDAQDLGRLVEVQRIKLGHERDRVARVALLLRIGDLEARLGRTDPAFDALKQAVNEDPGSQEARTALEALAGVLDRWPAVIDLYEAALKDATSTALQRELLLAVAISYHERLGQPAKAIEFFRRAQEIDPEDTSTLDALEGLYTRAERWADLVDTLRKKADRAADPALREQICVRVATVFEEMIGSVEEAVTAWKEVLGQNAESIPALRALDRLYTQTGESRELADNLQRQLQLTQDTGETVTLLVRLGHLRETKLGETAAAVETYRRVLELEPGQSASVEGLERLLPNPEHELDVAQLLEPVYESRGEYARLVAVYEIEAKHALDPAKKVALLYRAADGYEVGMDDPARAYDALARALAEDASASETQARIEKLARVLGMFEDLATRYSALAKAATDELLKNALLHKAAAIHEVELSQDGPAAQAYALALEVSPRDIEAANALERIYTRNNEFVSLVGLLIVKADIVENPEDKRVLYFKAAQIHEEVLENPDKAVEVWRQVLALNEGDREALENLERLFVRLSRWADLKDVYARKAELATDAGEKKQMLFVLGGVYERELADPARAIETYQAILDIDGDDFDAVQALERLYHHTKRHYDLLGVLEREVELASSTGEIVALRFRIGELWRTELKDNARAVEAFKQVLAIDPAHDGTLAALDNLMRGSEEPVAAAAVLEPIFEAAGEWERVAEAVEVMARHAEDGARKVELLGRIADIQERRLGRGDAAIEAWGRALALEPGNTDVIGYLERLAGSTGLWSRLAELYAGEVEKLLDARPQVEMLLRLARVFEVETGEMERAIATYRRAVEADGECRDAWMALDRLYSAASRWQELTEVLRREIRLATSDQEIVEHTFRLGQVFEVALSDMPSAVESYRDILNADPSHEESRAALERLFAAGAMQLEIANILEPLYRLGEDWEKLVRIYEVQLGKQSDPHERQQMMRRLAEITEQKLVDQVAAFEWWCRAVMEDPASELALDEMLRLVRLTHQWDAFVSTMIEAASHAAEPAARRDVLVRLSRAFEIELQDIARAEEVLLQVLGENESDPEVLSSLDRLYESQGMAENLAGILRRRIAITDAASELVPLQLRLGRVLAEALNDADGATSAYVGVLEHESRNTEALEALERVYFRGEKWAELFGVYEKMVDLAPGDEALADCYAHMAKIASDALDDRARAVELWARVLDLRGDEPVALGALADLHEAAEEWREITEVVERQVRATVDAEARVPLYKRLGRVWGEKLGRERNSLESWLKVLEIDPGDAEALRAVAANYRSAGAWEELAETIGRLIQVGQDSMSEAELKDLFVQLGEIEGETLMRTQAAVDAWRHVLDLDPQDFRAIAALEKLFTQEARWEECIEVLERRAGALAGPAEQVDVLMQVASLWAEKVGDGGAAAGVYERILQIDPSHLAASTELEQLYRQRKNWMKLVELLLARTEFVAEAEGKITLFCQIADIYEKQIGDRESAFITLQAAFREDYSNDQVAKELERLATASGKWNELLSDYTQLVQGITDKKQAADLWVKIGRWYDSALAHLEYAIASAQQALALEPMHVGALAALEDFFRKQARWQDLVSALARHAEVEQEPNKRVDILLQLADTYETQIGDAAQATIAYQRALDADEKCVDAIGALERLYRRTQAWDRLVEVLAKKSHIVDDGELAIRLRLQVGELWEDRLGDNDRAVEAYKEVLTVDPQNLDALKALERLFEKTGKMEAYLDNLETQLDVVSSDSDRSALYLRMAVVWEEQFNKTERAAECLEKILAVDDRNQRAHRDLERIYRQDRRWTELVDVYRRHILITNDIGERTELYFRMGQVYEEDIRDPDRAIEAFSDILSFDADHAQALGALARLYEQIEQWDRALEAMQRLLRAIDDPRQKVDLSYRVGKVLDERMSDPDGAEERLVEALSLDPSHVPSMLTLLGLYKRRGDWLKAGQLMVRAEAHTTNVLEKTRLLFDAARIFHESLADEDRAEDLYSRVLEHDPEHVAAAEPLADILFRRKEWARLAVVLEMLIRKGEKRSNAELNTFQYRLARAAAELGDEERALRHYRQAYDLDSKFLPTLLERAALLYKREQWDEAFKIYQTILVHHRETQRDDEIVEIFFRLGRIKLQVGERSKAINMFEKALEIQPSHRASLSALIDVHTEAGDFEAVIRQKRALAAGSNEDKERFALLEQIGHIYKEKLANPQKAIGAFLEALDLRPNAHHLLHEMLDLFSETKQWKKAVEILGKLVELEQGDSPSSRKIRAKYLEAAGNICRDELHSTDEAVDFYNQALDEDSDNLKTFERIDKIMTSKKDWKNQERNFRKMVKRIGLDAEGDKKRTLIMLLHALGEIYRSRLKDHRAAIETFELVVKLEPEVLGRQQILAELYQMQGPETYEKAIEKYALLVKASTDFKQMVPHLKTLYRLYMEMRQYDRAWCTASVLAVLRQADAAEQQFAEQYKVKGFVRAKARLTEELWQRHIYHPDEDRYVSAIFGALSQAIAGAYAKDKELPFKRKDRRDLANDPLTFSKVFNYVAVVLNVTPPEVYIQPQWAGEIEMVNAKEKNVLTPSFVVGGPLLQGRPEKELAYIAGKRLAMMRADHMVRWPQVVSTLSGLKAFFLATLKTFQPQLPIKGDYEQAVVQAMDLLRKTLPPDRMEVLGVVVQKFLATKAEADLSKWAAAVDLTCTRAGFLVANDLDVVVRMIQAEPVSVGTVEPQDKVRDLLQWVVSPEHFALREHLGITIGQNA